mgnify:CR=1 FL=1
MTRTSARVTKTAAYGNVRGVQRREQRKTQTGAGTGAQVLEGLETVAELIEAEMQLDFVAALGLNENGRALLLAC